MHEYACEMESANEGEQMEAGCGEEDVVKWLFVVAHSCRCRRRHAPLTGMHLHRGVDPVAIAAVALLRAAFQVGDLPF